MKQDEHKKLNAEVRHGTHEGIEANAKDNDSKECPRILDFVQEANRKIEMQAKAKRSKRELQPTTGSRR